MCYYEVPVIQWLPCGHARSIAAVRRYCNFEQDLSIPPSSRIALPEACTSPEYFECRIPVQALCPGCAWADYHSRVEEATALFGPEVFPFVQRPPYLIPLYRDCSWPEQSGLVGLGPTPVEFRDEERRARVAEWVLLQTQYRYEAVQRSSLCAMGGASVECLPPGWIERTRTRLMVPLRLPAHQDADNARIGAGQEERPERRGFGEGWRG
ncbi:hypothetical protein LXA43DRAFT_27871 [Ganoderma leucocontextum]|nr:hypothetical protein LXA43DRAFT_27871 [Ganoderma leucocontextum]